MRRGGRSGSHRLRSSPAQLAQALKVLNLYFDNNDIEQQRHRETGITKTGNNMELKDIAISKLRLREIWKPISQNRRNEFREISETGFCEKPETLQIAGLCDNCRQS